MREFFVDISSLLFVSRSYLTTKMRMLLRRQLYGNATVVTNACFY